MSEPQRVYFAGSLFNHKDLVGNLLLAAAIEKQSNHRFKCVLPQDFESPSGRAVEIRNEDLRQLMSCDLALFDFNGAELDAGTVVEFIVAKFLDIPAVIHRSDFRMAGDQGGQGDAWNLMCSFYPRTKVVSWNGMAEYQTVKVQEDNGATVNLYVENLAGSLVMALDEAQSETPLGTPDSLGERELLEWVERCVGGGFKMEP